MTLIPLNGKFAPEPRQGTVLGRVRLSAVSRLLRNNSASVMPARACLREVMRLFPMTRVFCPSFISKSPDVRVPHFESHWPCDLLTLGTGGSRSA